jgi:hypothetical protein
MKKPKHDDSAAKAVQERYARVLGLDQFSTSDTPGKTTARGYLPILILLALVLAAAGAWHYYRPPTSGAMPAPGLTSPAAIQPLADGPTHAEPPPAFDAGHAETVEPAPSLPDAVAEEPASADKTQEAGGAQDPQPFAEPQPSGDSGSLPAEASNPSFVVLLSTTSKEAAIARARELGNSGNPSEVILSTSGYYGVVLRRESYEQAQAAMQAIVASGTVRTAPYIMSAARVKERIYPERPPDSGKK